jgi:hypothetical protein
MDEPLIGKDPDIMEVLLDPLDQGQVDVGKKDKRKKRRRPAGAAAPAPSAAAREIADELCRREPEWLDRLTIEPATFAAVEREVHDQARRHADRFVAGLLAKASVPSMMAGHVEATMKATEAPLGAVEKKDGR